MSENVFEVFAGSDLPFSFNWPDGAGGNADLTGYTVSKYRVNAAIDANTTVTLTNPATGEISVRIEWDESYSLGEHYEFRVLISIGTDQRSTEEMRVIYT